jgi:transposase
MEEELLMQRREEEGKGKERRKALLEREERKWKEMEASIISSIPNVGSKEAAAMAAAVRAVGGDALLDDAGAREQVSSIARRILAAQMARRAEQVCLYSLYWTKFRMGVVFLPHGYTLLSRAYMLASPISLLLYMQICWENKYLETTP